MERIGGLTAMRHGIGQRPNDFHEFDHRTRPAMRHEQRACCGVWRPDVHELDVQTVDFGDELWVSIEGRLAATPVVLGTPVLTDFTGISQRNTLAPIARGFAFRPAGLGEASRQIIECGLWHSNLKEADVGIDAFFSLGLDRKSHSAKQRRAPL